MSKLSIDVCFVAKSCQLIPKLSILQIEYFCLICCSSLAVKSKMVQNFKSSPKNNYFFKIIEFHFFVFLLQFQVKSNVKLKKIIIFRNLYLFKIMPQILLLNLKNMERNGAIFKL